MCSKDNDIKFNKANLGRERVFRIPTFEEVKQYKILQVRVVMVNESGVEVRLSAYCGTCKKTTTFNRVNCYKIACSNCGSQASNESHSYQTHYVNDQASHPGHYKYDRCTASGCGKTANKTTISWTESTGCVSNQCYDNVRCSVCSKNLGTKAHHHQKIAPTCTSAGKCYCGKPMGDKLPHNWVPNGYSSTHTTGQGHKQAGRCSNAGCGATISDMGTYQTSWVNKGYSSKHTDKGHPRIRQCQVGKCTVTEEVPEEFVENWVTAGYEKNHTRGKGHTKMRTCQVTVSGAPCGQSSKIEGQYYENWSSATKWFPYDEERCILGRRCIAKNCDFPSNGGEFNEEGYDDYGGEKKLHDMDTIKKSCKRCGWSDKPPAWKWNETERNAFNKVSGYYVTDLTWTRWNEFVEHVKKVVTWYYGSSSSKPSLTGASMTSTDRVLTAYRFNKVRFAIGSMNATGISEVYPGWTVYGDYFITLEDRVNNIRK